MTVELSPREWVQHAYADGARLSYLKEVLSRQLYNMESAGLHELSDYCGTGAKLKVVKAMITIGLPDLHEDIPHASQTEDDGVAD